MMKYTFCNFFVSYYSLDFIVVDCARIVAVKHLEGFLDLVVCHLIQIS